MEGSAFMLDDQFTVRRTAQDYDWRWGAVASPAVLQPLLGRNGALASSAALAVPARLSLSTPDPRWLSVTLRDEPGPHKLLHNSKPSSPLLQFGLLHFLLFSVFTYLKTSLMSFLSPSIFSP